MAKDLIGILCEASMIAAVNLLERFPKVNASEEKSELVTAALRKVLGDEMPGFIAGELREAKESNLGAWWLKELINVQVNRWAFDALKIVEEQLICNCIG